MPIKVNCNNCSGVLHAPDDAAGKRGRCPTCGTILTIPADGPRVAADQTPSPPAFGIPASAESLAFPRPPAIGTEAGRGLPPGLNQPSSSIAPMNMGSRLPPDPRRSGDPFARPGKPPMATGDGADKKWRVVQRGLGMVGNGVGLITFGVLVPTAITVLEQNGVALPDKDPGFLGTKGLSSANEIKIGIAVLCFLIGGLMIVLGRLRVAKVPRDTGARGIATAAAYGTIVAWIGFAFLAISCIAATLNDAPPQLIPHSDVLSNSLKLQVRVENYLMHLFLPADDPFGQAQRYSVVAFIACAVIAEIWFLGTLSRLAVGLRSNRAIGRVNRFAIAAGILLLLAAFGLLVYDLVGADWAKQNVNPKWHSMSHGAKISARAAGMALLVAALAFVYMRSLRGVRTAIREANPS